MATSVIELEVGTHLVERAACWPARVGSLVISDQQTYERACELIIEIKALRREIEEKRKFLKSPVNESARRIDASAREADEPLARALAILDPRKLKYELDQEAIRRAEQRRLDEEARRKAEEEQLAAAVAAEEAGVSDEEVAALLDEKPVVTFGVVAPPRVERVSGLTSVTTYSAKVVDLRRLVNAIAAGRVDLHLLQPNLPSLNALARSQQERFAVPGCELVKTTQSRATGR